MHDASASSFSVYEVTLVSDLVSGLQSSFAIPQVVLELTLILGAIGKSLCALAVFVIVLVGTDILIGLLVALGVPLVRSSAVLFPIFEGARVPGAVRINAGSFTVRHVRFEQTGILDPIGPEFLTAARSLVIDEGSLVACTVRVGLHAFACHFVVLELADVLDAVGPDFFAVALGLVVGEVASIFDSIGPGQHALALFEVVSEGA